MDPKQLSMPLAIAFGLAIAAMLSAYAVNTGIRITVAPEEGALTAVKLTAADPSAEAELAERPQPPVRVKDERTYVHEILKRNIFDSAFIETYAPASATGGNGQVRTDLRVSLLGTVVAVPETYSSALIMDETEKVSRGYGIGDKIYDAEVVSIEKKAVTLRRGDGRIERITMDDDKGPRPEPVAGESGGAPEDGNVEKVSETKFVVDRSLIEQYLSDIESISRLGRALLHRGPDGEFDGFRLSAIRRNTVADQLGIKNGDVVHTVNGMPLNSVQGAMSAYQQLMSEGSFNFEVTRRGQKMTLEYEVR